MTLDVKTVPHRPERHRLPHSDRPDARTARRRPVATAVGLLVGGFAYFMTLLNYGTDLGRTAVAGGYFSNFFDDQARAFLAGSVSMPPETLDIEGFVHDGKTYTYFPPFPALLRLPILMTTREFDYQLTVLSMAAAWIVLAVMATKLVWLLVDELVPASAATTRTTAALAAIFIAGATGGTFLTYDASLPWVYHEVYTWAVTGAVGALYWMVRVVMRPSTHAVFWLCVFGFVSVGSRATEGWAVSLGAIALGLLMLWRPFTPEHRPLWWRTLLAGAAPLAASIALNLYKFDAVYMFPLKDQVWTQVNEQRQAALAANGGTLSGPQFFTTSFMAYFRPDGIRFTDHFPWITLPAEAAPSYHGAFVDQAYRTGSMTAFMATFFVLLAVALLAAFWPGTNPLLARLRIPLVASIIATGGVMNYGYYSTRYASDFVPSLVLGAAVGTALIARRVASRPRQGRPFIALVGVGVAFAIVAQMSIGFFMAAVMHRGDPLVRYVELQGAITPGAQAELVRQVDGLPDEGRTDELAIRGECEALYLHTGDQYEPWVPVEERDQVWRFEMTGDELVPGRAYVARFTGKSPVQVWLETSENRTARFLVIRDSRTFYGAEFEVPTSGEFSLGVRNILDIGFYRIESVPGGPAGFAESVYFDDDWNSVPAIASTEFTDEDLARLGLTGERELGLPTPVCTELAQRAGIDVG